MRTEAPRSTRVSTSRLPMKPVPPMIVTFEFMLQSVGFDSRGFDHTRPKLGLRLDERGELAGRIWRRGDAEVAQCVGACMIRKQLVRFGIELPDDFRRLGHPIWPTVSVGA